MKDIEIHPNVILTEAEYQYLLSCKTKLTNLKAFIKHLIKKEDKDKVLCLYKVGGCAYSSFELSANESLYEKNKQIIALDKENKQLRERNKLLEANFKPWQDALDYKKQFCQEKADFNELPWYEKMRYEFKI